ncbi:dirigent protein 25-like protein [Cinnamomum micranthum f. kanehirae]|uniref:Dirigent protein n=1 Tax=Cinnamomum micranthum f. kanehirae TaxID=337451 RepID=A0A443PRT2_9MAGN|nr:dirigent protein 25-like protein [Cinnamomum micranthum f. kanehirae]
MVFTVMFESGHYVDSISFFGVHHTASSESQVAVMGGTEKYTNAKGFATIKTIHPAVDQHTIDGVETLLQRSRNPACYRELLSIICSTLHHQLSLSYKRRILLDHRNVLYIGKEFDTYSTECRIKQECVQLEKKISPLKDLNEEVQERGCCTWIFTKMKDKRKKMAINSFMGLDLMRTSFGIKIKQGKMKRARGEDCWKEKRGGNPGEDPKLVFVIGEGQHLGSIGGRDRRTEFCRKGEDRSSYYCHRFCRPSPDIECSHHWSPSPLPEKTEESGPRVLVAESSRNREEEAWFPGPGLLGDRKKEEEAEKLQQTTGQQRHCNKALAE